MAMMFVLHLEHARANGFNSHWLRVQEPVWKAAHWAKWHSRKRQEMAVGSRSGEGALNHPVPGQHLKAVHEAGWLLPRHYPHAAKPGSATGPVHFTCGATSDRVDRAAQARKGDLGLPRTRNLKSECREPRPMAGSGQFSPSMTLWTSRRSPEME